MAELRLKLLVDKKKNRVVFAESDKDFVDILFSFLTLPMGTIVKLLGKNSGLGCMDKLYESVEKLDKRYLQTDACKTMLLQPRSESERPCEDLMINVGDLKPRRIYLCPNWDCVTKTNCHYTTVPATRCPCGQVMDQEFLWRRKLETLDGGGKCDGVFVKGSTRFVISDDLCVTPISVGTTIDLLQRLGIKDADSLQKKTVVVSKDEILKLLKRTLHSKTPLTDVFLSKRFWIKRDCEREEEEEFELIDTSQTKAESNAVKGSKEKTIHVRLLESNNKVVWAEAGEELVDILFSFLTLPLGSIVKLLNKHSSLGCVDHLYQSVKVLSTGGAGDDDYYIKSEECKNMLLSPKLASHFGCNNQLFRIDEKLPTPTTVLGCKICFNEHKHKCSHGLKDAIVTGLNPKLPIPGTENGGGFAKRSVKFMVMNEMMVNPISPISGISAAKKVRVPIASLVERDIICGEAEVLNMLKACLISPTVLSDVFSPKQGDDATSFKNTYPSKNP